MWCYRRQGDGRRRPRRGRVLAELLEGVAPREGLCGWWRAVIKHREGPEGPRRLLIRFPLVRWLEDARGALVHAALGEGGHDNSCGNFELL